MEYPNQARKSFWQRLKKRKWRLLALIPTLIVFPSYFGAFSPLLSPLVYPNLAPPGWHNATPHGDLVLYSFAASADSPGLIVACGSGFSATWNDPSTGIFGRLHFWRSLDGGAHWEPLHPSFGDGQQCDVTVPDGEPHTIFVTADSSSDTSASDNVAVTWVSHDHATTWRRVATSISKSPAPLDSYGPDDYYRNGLLYGHGAPGDSNNYTINSTLAYSADDGASWTAIPSTPSNLEQQGWQVSGGPVPDYRGDHSWYRTVSASEQPPILEHSTDDGRIWTLIGALGSEPIDDLILATTSLLPNHLCAALISPETDHLSISASADGGKTWQTGVMPASLANTTGETKIGVQIGADGDLLPGLPLSSRLRAAR